MAALIFSANPGLGANQAEDILKANADDLGAIGWDGLYGMGRINAARKVAAAIAAPVLDSQAQPFRF